jgi:hypothetical protein
MTLADAIFRAPRRETTALSGGCPDSVFAAHQARHQRAEHHQKGGTRERSTH